MLLFSGLVWVSREQKKKKEEQKRAAKVRVTRQPVTYVHSPIDLDRIDLYIGLDLQRNIYMKNEVHDCSTSTLMAAAGSKD